VPFVVNKNYTLPQFVNKDTWVIANSYSGNTEETLSAYKLAVERKAKILCMASGGQLAGMAKENGHDLVILPKGFQPRESLMFSLIPVVKILWQSKAVDNAEEMCEEAAALIKGNEARDKGEQLAETLKGKIPIIYSGEHLKAVAMRWKTQVNENAKQPAYYNMFPEMNHNEINSFANTPLTFGIIYLRDKAEHERVAKRFEIIKGLVSHQLEEVWAQGYSRLAKICHLVNLGDWYSYYLALLNNTDPTPVSIIESLKKQLQ
jgi:glucose/mannose-6-phosphate isomerase